MNTLLKFIDKHIEDVPRLLSELPLVWHVGTFLCTLTPEGMFRTNTGLILDCAGITAVQLSISDDKTVDVEKVVNKSIIDKALEWGFEITEEDIARMDFIGMSDRQIFGIIDEIVNKK